jgi:hypothetical protein
MWVKLKYIPSNWDHWRCDTLDSKHLECAKALSGTLENFTYPESEPVNVGDADGWEKHEDAASAKLVRILNSLPNFKNLSLRRYSNYSVNIFDAVFELWPLLTTIEFINFPSEKYLPPSGTAEMMDLSTVTPQPQMETFEEISLICNDNSLLYIMKNFPQLKELTINKDIYDRADDSVRTKFLSKEPDFKITTLVKFMLYLDSVPKHHVEVIVRKYIINDLMTNYLQSKSNNILGPFKITYTGPELQSLFIELKVKLCMESPSVEETKLKGL